MNMAPGQVMATPMLRFQERSYQDFDDPVVKYRRVLQQLVMIAPCLAGMQPQQEWRDVPLVNEAGEPVLP